MAQWSWRTSAGTVTGQPQILYRDPEGGIFCLALDEWRRLGLICDEIALDWLYYQKVGVGE